MEDLYAKYGKDVEFFIVYIREAHPNREYPQPKTFDERVGIADTMCSKLEISIPTLIDGMENKTGTAYAGFPDRIYLVGRDGKIAYKGARGPFGFKPPELDAAIEKELSRKPESTADN